MNNVSPTGQGEQKRKIKFIVIENLELLHLVLYLNNLHGNGKNENRWEMIGKKQASNGRPDYNNLEECDIHSWTIISEEIYFQEFGPWTMKISPTYGVLTNLNQNQT